jgi:hypothetical protein
MDLSVDTALSRRPLLWRWCGIYVAATAVLLTLLETTPIVSRAFLPVELLGSGLAAKPLLLVHGGLWTLASVLLIFLLCGGLVGGLARRWLFRELIIGGLLVALVQWGLWTLRVHGEVGALASGALVFAGSSGEFWMPPLLGLLMINLLGMATTLVAAAASRRAVQLATGQTLCEACERPFRIIAGSTLACPACGEPVVADRRAVRWGYVGAAASGTAVVFALFVALAGPALGFYWRCDFAAPDAACQRGIRAHDRSDEMYFWRAARSRDGDPIPGSIVHPWKYIGFCAPLFALAPFLLAARLRRGRARSAQLAALLAWPAATMAAMAALGFAQLESVIVLSLRLHLLAGFAWGAAGALGCWLGGRFARDVGLDEELGIDLGGTPVVAPPPRAEGDRVAASLPE